MRNQKMYMVGLSLCAVILFSGCVRDKAPLAVDDVDQVVDVLEEKSSLSEESASFVFDMVKVNQTCEPCMNECTTATPEMRKKVEDFYDALANHDIEEAQSFVRIDKDENLFGYIFPVCSAMHQQLANRAMDEGIIIFILSGNAEPTVPNRGEYTFGYLWAENNKILLKEVIIEDYFDNAFGKEYAEYIGGNSNITWERSVEILAHLENEVIEGLETEFFAKTPVQDVYDEFVATLK